VIGWSDRRSTRPAWKVALKVEETGDAPALAAPVFEPLPLGSIRPRGWLAAQLRVQADGLSGHLDEIWPDVRDSAWIGGDAEGWERGPYWLDGVIPLAAALYDRELGARTNRWVDYILEHQHADGWLGPIRDTSREGAARERDPWPQLVVLKALAQHAEWRRDPRCVPAMRRNAARLAGLLGERPLHGWGRARWAELLISLHWLHQRTRDDRLLDLARLAREQGWDWRAHFEEFRYPDRVGRDALERWRQELGGGFGDVYHATHGVNNAMGVKAPALWWRHSRDPRDRDAARLALEVLDRHHGQPSGMFSCDEHLAGRHPSQGSELCAVVELMYSLETALAITGDAALGDRLEKLALNALPAAFTADMWAHQYDQQANQVVCRAVDDPIYTNNGPRSNLFGLEPQFGCCTANLHQGWPKLVSHLWLRSTDGGLAAVSWLPCVVDTELHGAAVHVEVESDYPFDEEVELRVTVHGHARFPLHLRVPAWAEQAELRLDDGSRRAPVAGAFCSIERAWSGTSSLRLRLPMGTRVVAGYRESVSIERGPLVFALAVEEDWRCVAGTPPAADWEVHPRSEWRFALALDTDEPVDWERRPLRGAPFSSESAPLVGRVRGARVPAWGLERGAAAAPPPSPVASADAPGPLEALRLLPYGAARLRVTSLPWLRRRP
jgi:hypothetical protein